MQAAEARPDQLWFHQSVSVFFPAFNDAPSIAGLVETAAGTLSRLVGDFEIIVVDDGSTDETPHVLRELQRLHAYLKVVTHDRNLGYGAALRSGFLAASKQYIFYTDGDGQYDPGELEAMLLAATPGVGLVNGYKVTRNDPPHRVAIGWLYNCFAKSLFGIGIRDIDCDFRLIRRDAFDPALLQSTSGSICVELVRSLENSGAEIVEIPVSHFERQHGRSQFFRVKSLFTTFLQIMAVYWRLVVKPAWSGSSQRPAQLPDQPPPTRRHVALVVLAVCLLSLLAYGRALSLPFISDDYVHIQVARDYGPVSRWGDLARDALYRCRTTSTWLAYLLDRTFGMDPVWFRASSLFFHIANGLLLFALGAWKRIGWGTASVAACFFAISQRHSEAVIWFAAIPELLVFFFLTGGFLCWILWLQSEKPRALYYFAAYAAFILALLSKESAVALVPLCAMATLFHPGSKLRPLLALSPFALTAAGYFALDWMARDANLFFSDGTFSLHAPVLEVVFRSTAGLLWFWGAVALIFAATVRLAPAIVRLSLGWTIVGLLPYSFLTYMPRVPSRHTYLASAGVAWLVAGAFIAFRQQRWVRSRRWLVPALAAVIVAHQCGYLWLVIHRRYVLRAAPTETLLKMAQHQPDDIFASCFPYSPLVADYALMTVYPERARPRFKIGPDYAKHPLAQDFCNQLAEGKRQ